MEYRALEPQLALENQYKAWVLPVIMEGAPSRGSHETASLSNGNFSLTAEKRWRAA